MPKPSSDILQTHMLHCFISGWTGNYRPKGYFGPTGLQIAHIASGGGKARRVDDRRAVLPLHPLVHDLHVSNSDAFMNKWIGDREWPTIDERHTLWAKREFDAAYYDPEFLQTVWIGRVPQPEKPPAFWVHEMYKSQGLML